MRTCKSCAIFIDGGYLSRILKDRFNAAKIDYLKLSNKIAEDLNLERTRTYFYHCMPTRGDTQKDKMRYSAMQKFLAKLRRLPRFEVKLGKLQNINGHFQQKMVDVLMSLDIADKCFDGQIEHAILIAGDSDFVPVVQRAKSYGAIIHLYYHPASVHEALLDEIDEYHLVTDEFVSDIKLDTS